MMIHHREVLSLRKEVLLLDMKAEKNRDHQVHLPLVLLLLVRQQMNMKKRKSRRDSYEREEESRKKTDDEERNKRYWEEREEKSKKVYYQAESGITDYYETGSKREDGISRPYKYRLELPSWCAGEPDVIIDSPQGLSLEEIASLATMVLNYKKKQKAQLDKARREQFIAEEKLSDPVLEVYVLNYWELLGRPKYSACQKLEIVRTPPCIYVPYKIPNKPFIYVPYKPDKNDNICIYVPYKQSDKPFVYIPLKIYNNDHILYSDFGANLPDGMQYVQEGGREVKNLVPVIRLGIGTIVGGGMTIASGPISAIIGGVLGTAWTIHVGIPLLRDFKAKIKAKKEAKEKEKTKGGGGGGDDDDDDDKDKDKDKDKKSSRIHEPNEGKHHPNSPDGIGKSIPKAEQVSELEKALEVPGEDYLVNIYKNKFVQFMQSALNKYHGYIVENFFKLPPAARTFLAEQGLVHCGKCGRIVK